MLPDRSMKRHGGHDQMGNQRPRIRQLQALLHILQGEDTEPGATVFQIFASTCDTLHEPIIADIEFELESTVAPRAP
jgi:hypothetical protein